MSCGNQIICEEKDVNKIQQARHHFITKVCKQEMASIKVISRSIIKHWRSNGLWTSNRLKWYIDPWAIWGDALDVPKVHTSSPHLPWPWQRTRALAQLPWRTSRSPYSSSAQPCPHQAQQCNTRAFPTNTCPFRDRCLALHGSFHTKKPIALRHPSERTPKSSHGNENTSYRLGWTELLHCKSNFVDGLMLTMCSVETCRTCWFAPSSRHFQLRHAITRKNDFECHLQSQLSPWFKAIGSCINGHNLETINFESLRSPVAAVHVATHGTDCVTVYNLY